MPTIDIDRDAAHEAAQHELAKPIYPKASLIDRLKDWIGELLTKLIVKWLVGARRLVHDQLSC